MADDLDTRLDHLYDLPPEQFVAARDALAKELKGEGRGAVKALRRPSVVAAIANRLARDEPQSLQALLAAGDHLREAQLGGSGDVRAAVAAQRSAVDGLVKAARKRGATGTNVDRLRSLLQAVAGDDDLRAALERGRIEREPAAGGAWPALTLTDRPARRKTTTGAKGGRSRAPRRASVTEDDDTAAAREQARLQAEAEEHDRLVAEAEARRKERDRDAARADKGAGRAQTRLERATAATTKAREALAAAEESEAEAREEAQRALRALKAAQAHLQEAQDDVAALRSAAPAPS